MRLIVRLTPALVLLVIVLLMTAAQAQKLSDQRASETSRVIESKLRTAAAQHEIISALLQKRDFSRIVAELKMILELRLPVDYESAVVEEVVSVSNRLADAQRYDLAHQAIAATLKSLTRNVSKYYLHIQDGRIYMKEGDEDAALNAFERSKNFRTN